MSSHPEISSGALPRSLRRVPTLDTQAVNLEAQTNAKRELHPQCFKDGTILEQLAFEHCESFRALFNGKRNFVPSCEITMGSACTGSACEVSAAYFLKKRLSLGRCTLRFHQGLSPGRCRVSESGMCSVASRVNRNESGFTVCIRPLFLLRARPKVIRAVPKVFQTRALPEVLLNLHVFSVISWNSVKALLGVSPTVACAQCHIVAYSCVALLVKISLG